MTEELVSSDSVRLPPGWYDDGIGYRRWWDGQAWTEWIDRTPTGTNGPRAGSPVAAGGTSADRADASGAGEEQNDGRGVVAKALLLGLPSLLILAAVVVVVIAFATVERWTVVDIPEHPETFHTEQYSTGAYHIKDNGVSPCYVGQDWFECRNSMVAEFNRECVSRQLTRAGNSVCDAYGAEIDRMEQIGQSGWVVESLGGYGYLSSSQETRARRVSNGDYRPAITHVATCYLGFIGECR